MADMPVRLTQLPPVEPIWEPLGKEACTSAALDDQRDMGVEKEEYPHVL